MAANPYMASLSLASSGSAYQLSALLAANDSQAPKTYAGMIQIQLDVNAGATRLYIGTDQVSSTNRGAELIAGQAFVISFGPGNSISLASIWLKASVNTTVVNITMVGI